MMSKNWLTGVIFLILKSVVHSSGNLTNVSSGVLEKCEDGWFSFRNKCYRIFGHEGEGNNSAWKDARAHCLELGGHLASIHSQEENDFITDMATAYKYLLIGLISKGKGHHYTWEDVSPYDYMNWRPGEPTKMWKPVDEDRCTDMVMEPLSRWNGRWNDIPCTYRLPYICQKKKSYSGNDRNLQKCPAFEGGGLKFRDSCYFIINEKMAWEEAEQYCQTSYSGHLVKILDVSHNTYLNYAFTPSQDPLWIGIKIQNKFQQHWSSNWPVAFENMVRNIREIKPGSCILRWNETIWTDAACEEKHPFICEKSKVMPPILKPPSQLSRCPEYPSDLWDFGSEYCYYINTKSLVTWHDALEQCIKMGGYLASIHSEKEEQIFHPFVKNTHGHTHIGLSNLLTHGKTFTWADGSPLDYTNWGEFQPEPGMIECVVVQTIDFKWHDYNCKDPAGFICQLKKVPLNETKADVVNCKNYYTLETLIEVTIGTLLGVSLVSLAIFYFRSWRKRKNNVPNTDIPVDFALPTSLTREYLKYKEHIYEDVEENGYEIMN